MKNSLLSILMTVLAIGLLNAQVGINTTNPQSQLDIRSSNQASPANTDGILVPKVDNFPSTNPTASQDGMLVFATGSGTPTKGFYYWDQTTSTWVALGGVTGDADWYAESTTSPPTGVNDDIYTLGNVAIGRTAANYPLHIDKSDATQQAIRVNYSGANNGAKIGLYHNDQNSGNGAHYGIYSRLIGSGIGTKIGVYNQITGTASQSYYAVQNIIASSGTGIRYGTFQQISGTGNGIHYGNYNSLISNGSGNKYGTYNTAAGGLGDKYGSYNTISPVHAGTHYGVFSNVAKAGSYAGYFLGNVAVGTASTNTYILPASRGTNGQIMQTDGTGNVSWVDNTTGDKAALKISSGTINGFSNFSEYTLVMPSTHHNLGGGTYNNTTGQYTIPYDGVYNISTNLNVNFVSSIRKDMVMVFRVYINGLLREQIVLQNGTISNSSYAQNFHYNSHINLNASDVMSFRILPVWGGTTPAPYISSGSNISVTKVY